MLLSERLFKSGSMSQSLGVYVPAIAVGRVVSLGRVLIFMHMVAGTGQFGLWTLGAMIFNMGAQVVTLGSNHGLTRYVSYYEIRRQTQNFYRRIRWIILTVCVVMTCLLLFGTNPITTVVITSKVGNSVDYDQQRLICVAAIGNALVMALYLNMLSFMYGMRAYKLASIVEVFSSVLFMILGIAALLSSPTALAILVAHGAAIGVTFLGGMIVLHGGINVKKACLGKTPEPRDEIILDPPPQDDQAAVAMTVPSNGDTQLLPSAGDAKRVFGFGLAVLASGLLWQALPYVSFFMTNKEYGQEAGGVFKGVMHFAQTIQFLGGAVFMVVFSHVAKRWEDRRRTEAVFVLETAYKALIMTLMTLAIIIYASGPLWLRMLPAGYQQAGIKLLGGQLMFFQGMAGLAIMNIVARLREKPIVLIISALAGGAANVILCKLWMEPHDLAGAAEAAGFGILLGAGSVALVYLLLSKVHLHAGTYIVLFSAVILFFPPTIASLIWVAVLLLAGFTNVLLTRKQKKLVNSYLHGVRKSLRRIKS